MAGIKTRQFTNITHQEHKRGKNTYILKVTHFVQLSSLRLQPELWAEFSYYDDNEICLEFLL